MNKIKQRLLQFIEYKGLSVRKFCVKNSISPAQLSSRGLISAFSTDILIKILYNNTELSSDWLLTGSGSMLRSCSPVVVSSVCTNNNNNTNTTISNCDDNIVVTLQKQILELNKQLANKDEQINKLLDLLKKQ